MKYTSIDIIFNPNSTGPSGEYARSLKRKLVKAYSDLPITLQETRHAGHAIKIAYDVAKSSKNPLIISSSGDGGYSEVINGAMKAQSEGASPICAVLAAGNANDHSRTLQDKPLFEAIVANKFKSIDLLKVCIQNGENKEVWYAHSYMGLGLTPVVAVELNKTDLNALKEFWIVLKTFYKFRPFKIKHNGKVITLDSIIFANIGEMAKLLTIAKNSEPDDGLFEVATFKHGHKFRLIRKLAKATVGGLEHSKHVSKYSFEVLKKMPAQLDGEVMFFNKNSVVIVESARQILRTVY